MLPYLEDRTKVTRGGTTVEIWVNKDGNWDGEWLNVVQWPL
jgi:hypothetical protein